MIVIDIALLWVFMLLFHELGHFIPLRRLRGQNVEIRFYYNSLRDAGFKVGLPEHYEGLSIAQNISISIFGVLAGFIPLLIFSFLIGSNWLYFYIGMSFLVIYTFGCHHDISKARRLYKWAKKVNHPLNQPL